MCVCKCTYLCVYMCVCVCGVRAGLPDTHTYTHTHINCTHTHTHTRTHAHTKTRVHAHTRAHTLTLYKLFGHVVLGAAQLSLLRQVVVDARKAGQEGLCKKDQFWELNVSQEERQEELFK